PPVPPYGFSSARPGWPGSPCLTKTILPVPVGLPGLVTTAPQTSGDAEPPTPVVLTNPPLPPGQMQRPPKDVPVPLPPFAPATPTPPAPMVTAVLARVGKRTMANVPPEPPPPAIT